MFYGNFLRNSSIFQKKITYTTIFFRISSRNFMANFSTNLMANSSSIFLSIITELPLQIPSQLFGNLLDGCIYICFEFLLTALDFPPQISLTLLHNLFWLKLKKLYSLLQLNLKPIRHFSRNASWISRGFQDNNFFRNPSDETLKNTRLFLEEFIWRFF